MADLLAEAKRRDAELEKIAKNAEPAGDADPYIKPKTLGRVMPSALVLIDKQQGWTSHDVVAKLRGILGTRKIGHAGTLDPMATGLLVLGVEGGTKLLQFISGSDKQYIATIRLGASTQTDDAEGEILSSTSAVGVSAEQIDAEIAKLTGEITQVPSSVSAIKVRWQARIRPGSRR